MELVVITLISAAIVLLFEHLSRRAGHRSRALSAAGMARPKKALLPRPGRLVPFFHTAMIRLGKRAAPRFGESLNMLIDESGSHVSLAYLQGLRLACGSAAALLALPVGFTGLILAPLLFALGFRLPILLLKRKRRKRMERIAFDLPEVSDLMAVLCFSGENLTRALRHSVHACGHPSSRAELELIIEHVDLGESTAEALSHAADHPCRELRRFGRTLIRADEYGAPIAETLEELASELRSGRRERGRIRASRSSVLILFPLVFLILPSFLLLTVGGMILGFTT
jgi:tight adherence protein C